MPDFGMNTTPSSINQNTMASTMSAGVYGADAGRISTAIATLDYLHPPVLVAYFVGTLFRSIVTLQKAGKHPVGRAKKRTAVVLQLIMMASAFCQAAYNLSRSTGPQAQNGFVTLLLERIPQHAELHVLGITLVWLVISLALASAEAPVWHPYVGTWALNALFETTLLGLSGYLAPLEPGEDLITAQRFPLAMNAVRVLCSWILLVVALFVGRDLRKEEATDEEQQPLLVNENGTATEGPNGTATGGTAEGVTANGTANGEANGSASSDSGGVADEEDEPLDRNKEIKEAQRKRLEEQGGWLGYLKGFAIFLPYLWPRKDWKGQVCLFIIVVDLILDRILNVLIPNEIGVITDKLLSGQSPWSSLGRYAVFTWLPSFAGWSLLRSVASRYVQNYSYAKICDVSFAHVMDLSMEFHSNKDSGEVLKSVEQANSLNDLLEYVLDTLPVLLDLMIAVWYVTHLFDVYLAFVVITFGTLYVWSGITLTTWTQKPRRKYVEKSRNESKTVYESISNWPSVTYFNRSDFERKRYADAVREAINAQWRYIMRSWGGHAVQSFISNLSYILCLSLAIWEISSGRKPVGNLVTFIMYWRIIMQPLSSLANTYRYFAASLIDAERVLQLLNTNSAVTDAPGAEEIEPPVEGRVAFNDVQFSYDPRKPVLKGIDFTAQPGQTIAFVGETGGGKSTILKLLFRFYDVTGGSVTIDGRDIRSLTLHSLRGILGAVPQDPSLFNQTIMENIRYARLEASDDEIHEACRAAAIHEKILSFPDGYKSKVGERGVKLSGGELQRVAIARILLKNPSIVMLDEATSAVDSSTEQQIQEAFRKLSTGRTTFVVAHRLSTIVGADRIFVIDKGAIVEQGTHEELLRRAGKYLELWTKQTTAPTPVPGGSKAPSVHGGEDGDAAAAAAAAVEEIVGQEVRATDDSASKPKDGGLAVVDVPPATYTQELTEAFAHPPPPDVVVTEPEEEHHSSAAASDDSATNGAK